MKTKLAIFKQYTAALLFFSYFKEVSICFVPVDLTVCAVAFIFG